MSAIAGAILLDGGSDAAAELGRMMQPLEALGPDAQSTWHGPGVALGFRQMITLPEDRFDRQPWHARDGGLVMVANVRLDNRDELGDALGLSKPSQRETSDSELLIKAYDRWEMECLERLVGHFAFAIWNARERSLFCARSHIDGPPLYYHHSARLFAFAATPTALFALNGVPRTFNAGNLALHIALVPRMTHETIFQDIFSLPLAHYLVLKGGRARIARYWRLEASRHIRFERDQDYADALRECVDRVVGAQLRSTGPAGSHLSAGCDSSVVTATAARLLAPANAELTAFTAAPPAGHTGPPGRLADESIDAAALAARFPNIRHVILRPDGRSLLDGLDRNLPILCRATRNPSNLPWLTQILEAAQECGIRVLLTGAKGNMTISYHGMPRLARLLRRGHWLALAREIGALRQRGLHLRALARATLGPILPNRQRRNGQRRDALAALATHCAINPAFAAEVDLEALARARDWDFGYRLPADGFTWRRQRFEIDETSDYKQAHLAVYGIDQRDPLADRRVVELCLAIPDDQYLRDGQQKFLYRRAFEKTLPVAELMERKRGFQSADWHDSLTRARGDVEAELDRLEASPWARRALDLPRLRGLVRDWPTGDWNSQRVMDHYHLMLSRAITMGRFIRWVEDAHG